MIVLIILLIIIQNKKVADLLFVFKRNDLVRSLISEGGCQWSCAVSDRCILLCLLYAVGVHSRERAMVDAVRMFLLLQFVLESYGLMMPRLCLFLASLVGTYIQIPKLLHD